MVIWNVIVNILGPQSSLWPQIVAMFSGSQLALIGPFITLLRVVVHPDIYTSFCYNQQNLTCEQHNRNVA